MTTLPPAASAFDVRESLWCVLESVRPLDDRTEGSGVDELGDLVELCRWRA
jgi:hypothetical protein